MRPTSAEMLVQRLHDFATRGRWIAIQQCLCAHDDAGEAVTALPRLLIQEPLAPGQGVEITFESMALHRPVKRTGTIVWCVATQDGTYGVGVRFEKFLGFADWQALTSTE